MNLVSSPTISKRRTNARGFTLVEMLVVMGIIGVIISIALPITLKARRNAAIAAAVRDLEAIRTGLEEYKNNFGTYPQTAGQFYPAPANAVQKDGATVLCEALTGLVWDKAQNKRIPILNPKSNRPQPALINEEKFNIKTNVLTNIPGNPPLVCFRDASDNPILYFPATFPTPDITQLNKFVAATGALYNYNDCPILPPASTKRYIPTLGEMQIILGDENANGRIDANEAAVTTAPFLLWGASLDGLYGLEPATPPTPAKTGIITNFPISITHRK